MTFNVHQAFLEFVFQLLIYYNTYLLPLVNGFCKKILCVGHFEEGYKLDFVDSAKLKKVPTHLAISFGQLLPFDSPVNNGNQEMKKYLLKVAEITYWASLLEVNFLSFYDPNGLLKSKSEILQQHIAKRFQRCTLETGNQILCEKEEGSPLTVFIRSREDGKKVLLQAIQNIYFANRRKSGSGTPITVQLLDDHINQCTYSNLWSNVNNTARPALKAEPDLLMILGTTKLLRGFLPWHVRNTEIHNLPQILDLKYAEFGMSIQNFANCEQRFGK